jgi:hypothetical protein
MTKKNTNQEVNGSLKAPTKMLKKSLGKPVKLKIPTKKTNKDNEKKSKE